MDKSLAREIRGWVAEEYNDLFDESKARETEGGEGSTLEPMYREGAGELFVKVLRRLAEEAQ